MPSPHAALLRIFHLATALAADGVPCEVWTGPLTRPAADCFRWAGLASESGVASGAGVRLVEVFPDADGGGPGAAAGEALDAALESCAATLPVLLLRGDAGAALLAHRLDRRRAAPPAAGPREVLLHELHRWPGTGSPPGPLGPLGTRLPHLLRRWLGRGLRLPGGRGAGPVLSRAVEGADGLVLVSEALGADLAERFRLPGPRLVLPSGAPPPSPLPATPQLADRHRDLDLVYTGKLERRKGVGLLLRALAHLPRARLLLVGGSPPQVAAWRRRARRRGLAGRVRFTGFLPPVEIPPLLARARVGVCPLPAGRDPVSDRYTSPMKLLGMMAAGLPVVATAVPPVRRLVRHGEDAWLVPANDPRALAAGLHRLLTDRPLAHRLATSARRRAADHAWPRRAAALEAFCQRWAGDPAKGEGQPDRRVW